MGTITAKGFSISGFVKAAFVLPPPENATTSLLFNNDDSAYLSRTPSGIGNRTTWTFSTWAKRTSLSSPQHIFAAGSDENNLTLISFDLADGFSVFNRIGSVVTAQKHSTAVHRDVSAWYHLVAVWDTSNATASERARLYVNGERITEFSVDINPDINEDSFINNNQLHRIGTRADSLTDFFDGYLTDAIFIDGQALAPTDFGMTDSNGTWVPKAYNGTYGGNGFRLDFTDNTSTTTLGEDSSVNTNNWTLNNFVVDDQVADIPTNNYATWNSLVSGTSAYNTTFSNGNLSSSHGMDDCVLSTIVVPNGMKVYTEITCDTFAANPVVGIAGIGGTAEGNPGGTNLNASGDYRYRNDGTVAGNGGGDVAYGATWTAGDTIGMALDLVNGAVWFSKNGTWQNGASIAEIEAGNTTNAAFTGLTAEFYIAASNASSGTAGDEFTVNFGQKDFAAAAPSGFVALNTNNLPTPTIASGGEYFNTVIYTGDASNDRAITGVGFQPDFVWIKNRSSVSHHTISDVLRGGGKSLWSDATDAEQTNYIEGYISDFVTDGFEITEGSSSSLHVNANGDDYVAWNWLETPTSGFDIVSYTGNGSNRTIGHNLGAVPELIIVKSLDGARSWTVYHKGVASDPETDFLFLDTTAAAVDDATAWNDTAPTDSVFSVGTKGSTNANGEDFIAYLFAGVEGFSKFGNYVGNGSNDGPFIYCGFRPAFVMIKKVTNASSAHWIMWDTARDTFNIVDHYVYANLTDAEGTAGNDSDILSNGFKLRRSAAVFNESGSTMVFAAFAEHPFKYARAR